MYRTIFTSCAPSLSSSVLSHASLRVRSLASAYAPALYRQSDAALAAICDAAEVCSFGNEFLVGQPLANCASRHAIQPVHRAALDVTFVQSEGEFVNVATKMLRAYLMVDAMNATLHDGPHGFDTVRADAVAHVFSTAMVDGFMRETRFVHVLVAAMVVRVEDRAGLYVVANFLMEYSGAGARNDVPNGPSATLAHAQNGSLAYCAATGQQLFACMLVLFFPAYVGLVDFNDAGQDGFVISVE